MRNFDISAEEAQKLRQLAELDDKTFTELLSSVVGALGASKNQIAMMVSNHQAIRAMIARASDNDIRKLAYRLGPSKTAEILAMIESATVEET